MKQTRLMMGMPIMIEIADTSATEEAFTAVYDYFQYVDNKFSTYKEHSEIMQINRNELCLDDASDDMKVIFALADQTRQETYGYFDIEHNGMIDPSGVVKGWAIYNAAVLLENMGYQNFYVDAGGDIQAVGKNAQGEDWRVGICNPFNIREIVKVIRATNCGVATSGSYVRGHHIYDPTGNTGTTDDVLSITVIGTNIYEADRFATAAFAMGKDGIDFIDGLQDFEGYMIDCNGIATLTSGFKRYVCHD